MTIIKFKSPSYYHLAYLIPSILLIFCAVYIVFLDIRLQPSIEGKLFDIIIVCIVLLMTSWLGFMTYIIIKQNSSNFIQTFQKEYKNYRLCNLLFDDKKIFHFFMKHKHDDLFPQTVFEITIEQTIMNNLIKNKKPINPDIWNNDIQITNKINELVIISFFQNSYGDDFKKALVDAIANPNDLIKIQSN